MKGAVGFQVQISARLGVFLLPYSALDYGNKYLQHTKSY
ncbi:hypothetical protein N476_06270 [Pseudoalteromonas luteoviolacea H33]|uniref:Uncharacterized protein n=1 Tax=Pseudoalteromonas luteoviolacea H33 TaxID=1365251 RepID=A0A166ZS23_9GAMM|nr:hypothetical protein N476_06270 [Pseudoalteromonas luteoviolacea H33]KZN75404.1 hypothetical protein N477_19280 [Pseudoalteromonas luteoviolacea H33-S]